MAESRSGISGIIDGDNEFWTPPKPGEYTYGIGFWTTPAKTVTESVSADAQAIIDARDGDVMSVQGARLDVIQPGKPLFSSWFNLFGW